MQYFAKTNFKKTKTHDFSLWDKRPRENLKKEKALFTANTWSRGWGGMDGAMGVRGLLCETISMISYDP